MNTNCKVCGVATTVKYRSELQSPSSKCCRETIVSLLSQHDEDMNKDDAAKEYSTGFVCRVCFLTVSKYQALRKKCTELENGLVTKLTSATTLMRSEDVPSTQSRGLKRRRVADNQCVKVICCIASMNVCIMNVTIFTGRSNARRL